MKYVVSSFICCELMNRIVRCSKRMAQCAESFTLNYSYWEMYQKLQHANNNTEFHCNPLHLIFLIHGCFCHKGALKVQKNLSSCMLATRKIFQKGNRGK